MILWVSLLCLVALAACAKGRASRATPTPVSTATPALVPTPTTAPFAEVQGIELVGYLGGDQVRAVAVHGDYAYVGFGPELAVLDVADPDHPRRVGYTVLSELVLDIAVAGTSVYVATGYAGLHVADVSDPTQPVLRDTFYPSTYVGSVIADGDYLYVSAGVLRILDIARPAQPVEISSYELPDSTRGLNSVTSVVGGYAYTVYHSSYGKAGGLHIVDVSEPTRPAGAGTFVAPGPVHDVAVVGDDAYLLIGTGMPHLVRVDISDPAHPAEVELGLTTPWLGQSLAAVDHYLYLVYPVSAESVGGLQILDVAEPTRPLALGRYAGVSPPAADIAIARERAYVAMADRLAVVDVADPNAPQGRGDYAFETLAGHGEDVAVGGGYAFVAAGEAGLQVVDVSDPVAPSVASSYDTPGHAWDVVLAGGYAYVADEYAGLRILDVVDPLRPTEIGFYDVPGPFEFFHGLAIANGYAYVADGGLLETGLRVVDVSDPTHPTEVSFAPLAAQVQSGLPARVEDVAVADGYVCVAAGSAGMRVLAVSDPVAPAEVGFYDTPGRADNLVVTDHSVYLIDGDLRVLDISEPAAPALVGFYDLPTLAATPHVAVQGHFAFVTDGGVRVLDVAVRGAPVEVDAHPFPPGNLAVADDKLYVIGNGLFIFAIRSP